MTGRILRTELRRSSALRSAVVLAALGVLVLYTSNPPQRDWIGLVIAQRDILQVFWPLALGAGAWQAVQGRRVHTGEIITVTPRPRWQRVLPTALATGLATAAAYIGMFAASVGHLHDINTHVTIGVLPPVAVGALSVLAASWLGLAIGSLLPSVLTPPASAVTATAAVAIVPRLLGGQGERPGSMLLLPYLQIPRSGTLELMTVSGRVNLAQALWFAALAATSVGILAATNWRARAAAVLPAIVGATLTLALLPPHLDDAYVPDHRAVSAPTVEPYRGGP
jgi:hypothetical protein